MVDIIMVLLIYFMLGTSLQLTTEGVLQTDLDTRSGPSGNEQVQINPTIRIGLEDIDDGQSCDIYVMEDTLPSNTFPALRDFLKRRRSLGADAQNPVVIGAQGKVRYKYIIKAFDACVQAGFSNVQFMVSMADTSEE
jgi:biopolymer transport protein ExbD